MNPRILAEIPSPTWSGFTIPGTGLMIHAYALCIMAGIACALWMTSVRWKARGGSDDDLWNIALFTIPAGIIGGRIYHVFSTPDPYFGPNGDPMAAFYIWNGGLGIWGAVALGVLVAFIVARYNGIRFPAFLDAAAPGLILAQAIGRWGNWFNQELFGAPTDMPWGLHIDKYLNGALNPNWPDPSLPADTLFQPTFLYESLWNAAGCLLLIWGARRFRLGHGQVFAAYICYYTLGRVWIEALRIDEAEHVLGLRLNVWTSIIVFAIGAAIFVASRMKYRTPEEAVYTARHYVLEARRTGTEVPAEPVVPTEGPSPANPQGFGMFGAVTSAISIVPQVSQEDAGREDGVTRQDSAREDGTAGRTDTGTRGTADGTASAGEPEKDQGPEAAH